MIYFTADLHFHHQNIIAHAKRPFSSVEEMDRVLAENWNRRVAPQDEVYILGDLTLEGAAQAAELLWQLNGQKYLVRGNHDRFTGQADFPPEQLVWVRDYYELCQDHQRLILCHYPFLEWNHALHLHGHRHGRPEDNEGNWAAGVLRYDVGVDANGFAPVSLPEILAFFGIGEGDTPPHTRKGEEP